MSINERISEKWPTHFNNLITIRDLAAYCKAMAALYHEDLSNEDKEEIASAVGSIIISDQFMMLQKQYPIINDIESLASDLEWSNSLDINEDWEKLLKLIDELERHIYKK